MSDEDWEAMLQEIRDAVPCDPCDPSTCELPELCTYLRACVSPSESE